MKALADIQPEDDELLALKNEFDQKMGELDEDKLLEAGGAFGDDEDDEDDGGGKKPSGGAGGGGSMGQMFNREYWKVRGELSADIENQYVERECRKAREQKEHYAEAADGPRTSSATSRPRSRRASAHLLPKMPLLIPRASGSWLRSPLVLFCFLV